MTSLTTRRRIAAPIDRVFEAWTTPALLRQWWGPDDVRCIAAEIDLRPGGAYRLGNEHTDGSVTWIAGTFEVIEPPHRLVYSWRIADEPVSRVTVTLAAAGDRATDVEIHHEQIATTAERDGHERGWIGCLDKLEAWAR
jgi:uncharacterized protein YndB with AHSA1/START domain